MKYIKTYEKKQKALKYKVGDYVNVKDYVVNMWELPSTYSEIIEIEKSPNDYCFYIIRTAKNGKTLSMDEINLNGKMKPEEIEEFKIYNASNKYNL